MSTPGSIAPGAIQHQNILDEHTPLLGKGKSAESYAEPDDNAIQLRLKNSGSVARDHLASERTYLAYVRTSLAISSAGVALMQLMTAVGKTQAFAAPFASAFVVLGILVLGFGTRRYFLVQTSLISGFYPTTTLGVALLSFTLGSLVTIVFGILLADRMKHS
ncbi:hypothetical protein CVT24_007693 [Panaeolus cyanescens]|uniref:DUF202 domain-containing protein n=1 Tax=Panaeolus cyanescens TaxID=181874 RepID=A0A409VRD2_9AGAR|nr:hypothetical protein CVT24_007693 [Panaeolus cyanescens]